MSHARAHSAHLVAAITALTGLCGCQSAGSRFLSLIGLQRQPLALALVMDGRAAETAEAINPFSRYAPLQKALSADLGWPLTIEPCLLFQANAGLGVNWYNLALVTPAQYVQLDRSAELAVLAIPVAPDGRETDRAVLVVPGASAIKEINDVRGRVVAFGPAGDSLTHFAALQRLAQAGLKPGDLALELLPVPGLKHFANARSVLQSVLNNSSAAGFVRQRDWEALPESADSDVPARNRLRIVAETIALPERLLIAGQKLDPATSAKVRDSFLAAGERHADTLGPLGIKGYAVPSDDVLAACRSLAVTAESGPSTGPAEVERK